MSTLTREARETIKWHHDGSTIAAYVRHYSGDDGWRGDACGCSDDRCIGYHHEEYERCGCLPVLLNEMVRDPDGAGYPAARVAGGSGGVSRT